MNRSQEKDEIIKKIANQCGLQVQSFSTSFGGSINKVFLLQTTSGPRILKINKAEEFPRMFDYEKQGLQALRDTKTFLVPEVFEAGTLEDTSFLLMEYVKEGVQNSTFNETFASKLVDLHQTTNKHFGFVTQNYIGSLPQYNEWRADAADFYISQRLEPQFRLAAQQGFSFRELDKVLKNIAADIPREPPALIHGDLWAGNFLVNEQGMPCLIDPAVCYGPREMDLAMMKLFGGFSAEIFRLYHQLFPLAPGYEKRVPLWQLYYLLVHLNLFGSGYLGSVNRVFRQYS